MDRMTPSDPNPARGPSSSSLTEFMCKDCQREVRQLRAERRKLKKSQQRKQATAKTAKRINKRIRELDNQIEERARSRYNENWAQGLLERGGSRSDRCKDHRKKHRSNTQGIAVAYIDLQTVGEVANRQNPTGPLGGLGPLPDAHREVQGTSYDLEKVKVGMTDADIVKIVEKLRRRRVLILKAGTGTGKSTFVPYRLLDPPDEARNGAGFDKLTDLGQIVVTEPRVQATIGVATLRRKRYVRLWCRNRDSRQEDRPARETRSRWSWSRLPGWLSSVW